MNVKNSNYMDAVISAMAASALTVVPLSDGTRLIPDQTYPLRLAYRSEDAIRKALMVATQGVATKEVLASNMVAVPVDIALNHTARVCGVRIRIANVPTAFRYGAYRVTLGEGATVLNSVVVLPNTAPADFVIFGVSSNGGMAQLTGIAAPRVIFSVASMSYVQNDACVSETINDRDINR